MIGFNYRKTRFILCECAKRKTCFPAWSGAGRIRSRTPTSARAAGVETAAAEPDVLLIAVEKVPDAMVVAMERAAKAELHNVFFIDIDANQLPEIFDAGEVDRIYVNFCDPWPPKRQAKRRLTHGNFLKLYRKVLKGNGQIHFKTDEIPQFGFELSEVTRDLHANGQRGVMTDYEAKFYAEGKNINRCVATMQPWEEP